MSLFLIAVSTALSISFLCSLLEATLLSLTPAQVAAMGDRHPRAAAIWRRFKGEVERPIAVILVLNTAAHTIGASVAGAEFERLWGPSWLLAFSLLLTYLMLQFTEILPKTLGVRYNARIAPPIAGPLEALTRALTPLLRFIHFVNRPFERRGRESTPAIEEIDALASAARTAGAIDARQARLIRAAALLPGLRVRQIMTPRTDVVFLKAEQRLDGVLDVVRRSGYTRLPVCGKDIDDVVGMLHVRDLFNHLDAAAGWTSRDFQLRRIMRALPAVPEVATVRDLLRVFQESRVHMAVVVDEHGATAGIATLEDVLEEMIGDIEDEFDLVREPGTVAESAGVSRVAGSIGLYELREQAGIAVEEDDVDTLGGLIQKRLGRLAEVGDRVRIGRLEARVLRLDRRRVGLVELRRVADDGEPSRRSLDSERS